MRNTFIDVQATGEEDEDDADLGRTQSDPTGGRSKTVQPLMRISEMPRVTPVPEGSTNAEAGEDGGEEELAEDAGADDEVIGADDEEVENVGLCGEDDDGEDEDDDDDDDDDSPLERTAGGGIMSTQAKTEPATAQAKTEPAYVPTSPSSTPSKGKGKGRPFALAGLLEEPSANVKTAAPPYPGGMPVEAMAAWGYAPPFQMYPGWHTMYSQMAFPQAAPGAGAAGAETSQEANHESSPSTWQPAPLPELGAGPPIGVSHSFHQETRNMGSVSPDLRQFTKVGYEGRLSVVSESQVHIDGVQRYLVQFSSGELSRADGVGFVFSPRLPCAKNIQRIVSIFVNQRGRICMRVFADIVRASAFVKPLECGDWVEMCIDLDNRVATFNVWPCTSNGWPPVTGTPSSTAEFPFGNKLTKLNQAGAKPVKLNVGHLACVVKNTGVTVTLGS